MSLKDINTTPPEPEPEPTALIPAEEQAAKSIFASMTGYSVLGLVAAVLIGGYALVSQDIIDTPEILEEIPLVGDRLAYLGGLTAEEYSFDADGPFAYQFTAGERTNYQLDTQVTGKGMDLGEESAISLMMNMAFGIDTISVDDRGWAELQLAFDQVRMTGSFMGEEVHLYQTGDDVQMHLNKFENVDTSAGDSIQGISQLEFFSSPVTMIVSPDGMVREVSGPDGFDTILAPNEALAPSQFPTANLEIGDSWVTDFTMPVPGLAVPAAAKAHNTLVRYDYIGARQVGVIQQQIVAQEDGGTIESPSSVLGESLDLAMPTFSIEGEN